MNRFKRSLKRELFYANFFMLITPSKVQSPLAPLIPVISLGLIGALKNWFCICIVFVTPSLFHSRLKTYTCIKNISHRILIPRQDCFHGLLPDRFYEQLGFVFFRFSLFVVFGPVR